jgi:hypothetical protein
MIACWSLFISEQRIRQLENIFEIKRNITDRVKEFWTDFKPRYCHMKEKIVGS